jgi:predicted small lipoprotein YifL
MNRRLRFLRALALASTGSVAACGARTPLDEGNTLPSDGDVADTVESDTSDTGNTVGPGYCLRYGASSRIECKATCSWSFASGFPECIPNTPGDPRAQRCGSIYCQTASCRCVSERESTCECAGAVPGPLPPPDLPTA